jgi:hypothetical protein
MEQILYDKKGEAVAYIATDYQEAIFLWDGRGVAYLYEENHVYGMNGRHLGWLINGILYDHDGARIGFTASTCPVPVGKRGPKGKRSVLPEVKPRWAAPPLPKPSFREAAQGLADFLVEGQGIY